MAEPLILLLALAAAGAAVLLPLRASSGDADGDAQVDDGLESAALRHRIALEALRDVEADRRSGSLDEDAYGAQLAEAEARAAATRAALEQHHPTAPERTTGRGRLAAVAASAVIGAVLLAGSLIPATGLANETVMNEPLAAARDAEAARQARIRDLLDALAADSRDPETLSALADAYLAGTSEDDLFNAAIALQALIALEPDRADAYERIMAAYLRAGDLGEARAAWTSYAERPTADPVELAFFDGLIALRGEGDAARAVDAFDRFLQLAPEDPRATMIRGLRDEAAADG
jgi:hypothetical protein